MCKAMASEGTGSTVGKGLVDEQAAGSAVSAALTAADPQVSISLPGSAQNSSETIVGHEWLQQLPRTSSLPAAGVMDRDGFQPGVLTSTPPAVTVSQTLPQGSSQSTELRFQQSSASSGLADQTTGLAGQATTTGLLEAMQHLHLQVGAGPSSTQQMTAPVYAAQATSTASVGSIGPSTSLQDSGDLMQLMGHVQQQQHQLTQEQEQQGQPLLELSQQQAVQAEDGTATLFFAKVPRTATQQQIQDVFARFGEVVSLNLFTPYENSPTSKGCGLVVMRSHADAAAAISGLDNYKWEGMHSTMVVKLMPPQRQRAISGGSSNLGSRSPAQASSSRGASAPGLLRSSSYTQGSPMRLMPGVDVPPPGCAPDAYKLFVGNLPRAYTEHDLLPIFETIGRVRELVVLRDRMTQESKGSAFVWYASGADADKAQVTFNMQLVLQHRSGQSSRPLVVRPAAPAKQGQQLSGMARGASGASGQPHMQMQQAYAAAMPQGAGSYAAVPVTSAQSSYGYGGMPADMAGPQLYYDTCGSTVAVVPAASYLQQQQQQSMQRQAQQPQQQPQQQLLQQQVAAVAHVQVPQPQQYAGPMLVSMSEAPPSGGYPQMMQVQQGQWQQQQQQPAYMAAAGYDVSGAAGYDVGGGAAAYDVGGSGGGGMPTSGPLSYGSAELQRHLSADFVQQQQLAMGSVVMSSVPQPIPAAQQLSMGGMLQQAGQGLAGSSMSPASNVLLSGSAGSSGSSNLGPLVSYQQLGGQHDSLIIPLSATQLNLISNQLPHVAAASGTSIRAEHNLACSSLALNVVASNRQQLNVAWQIVQGLLGGQAGGAAAQVMEGGM